MLSAYRYRSVLITFHEFYFVNECSAMADRNQRTVAKLWLKKVIE